MFLLAYNPVLGYKLNPAVQREPLATVFYRISGLVSTASAVSYASLQMILGQQ